MNVFSRYSYVVLEMAGQVWYIFHQILQFWAGFKNTEYNLRITPKNDIGIGTVEAESSSNKLDCVTCKV